MRPSLLSLGYALGWLPMFLFRVEPLWQALPHYATTERISVLLVPVLVSLHVTLACLRLDRVAPSGWPLAAGTAVYLAAIGFWYWGRRRISPLRVRRLTHEAPPAFHRDGAFGWVRHPIYASYAAASLAPVIATGSATLAATFLLCFAAIALRAEQEERWMRRHLGTDYELYSRQVKRLIPFVW